MTKTEQTDEVLKAEYTQNDARCCVFQADEEKKRMQDEISRLQASLKQLKEVTPVLVFDIRHTRAVEGHINGDTEIEFSFGLLSLESIKKNERERGGEREREREREIKIVFAKLLQSEE